MSQKRKHVSDDEAEDLDKSERTYYSDEEGGMRIDDIYIPPPPRSHHTVDSTGPRLIIKQIVNTNFKSYGTQQCLGPFHKYFNAIVGPNGSGKSNVIDSMLFVFGYRASKIRSKKLSVLIHKSERYPNVQSATVAVHFVQIKDDVDDCDKYEEVPNSDLVVTRSIHKDNTSYYTLNGQKVSPKQVALVLRQHGVDLDHNRFLILQGEVEQISLMKPRAATEHDTGMLEYLEDIIGTTRFKEPLARLDEKIQTLSEERVEKLTRVLLAQKERDDLQAPMEEAVQYLSLENEITKKKNYLFQRLIKDIDDNVAEKEAEKAKVAEKLEAVNENLKEKVKQKKELEREFHQTNEKYEGLVKRRDGLSDTFKNATNEDAGLAADLEQTNKRRKKVLEQIKIENKKLENFKELPSKNLKVIEDFEKREKQLTENHKTFESERTKLLTDVRDETAPLLEQKKNLQTTLVDLRNVADNTKSKFTLAESELKLMVSSEEKEVNKLETLKKTFEENEKNLVEKTVLLKEAKQKAVLTEKSYKEAQTDLDQVKREEFELIQDVKTMRVKLEEFKSSMQSNKSRGRVLDALMQQKREGTLPGIFGRLGDLGAVDQKYDVATSTACGALDNIVVDTADTAQKCIDFLKRHDVGRATFIALDKIEYVRKNMVPIQAPENVDRLFDLIKIEDDRIRIAFYFALRDTLVTNELNQATRISYGVKQYRVVTLKGELIESDGTISGGGNRVFKGRIGQSVAVRTSLDGNPRQIAEMEGNLQVKQQTVSELHAKKLLLEQQVSTLQQQLRQLKTDVERYSVEVNSLQQQQPNLKEQLKRQEIKAKSSVTKPADVKKLQANVDKTKAEYEEAYEKSEELQQKVNEVQQEIDSITHKKMGSINKKFKENSQMLEKCKDELVKLRVAIKTSERNASKCSEKINNMESEKTLLENKLIAMREQRRVIEEDAKVLLKHIEDVTKEIEEEEENSSESRTKITELTNVITEIKKEKVEIDIEITKMDTEINKRKKERPYYEHELKNLKIQEIPNKPVEELEVYSAEDLKSLDVKHISGEIIVRQEKLKGIKPNLLSVQEFFAKERIYLQRVTDLEVITDKRNNLKSKKEEVKKKRQDEFYVGFRMISSKLKEMYQMITLGGDAELDLVDSFDPFSEGIVLNVRPPKKSWKNITNLSGGEKTLSSLALVFALHHYKPSPLYFMDEIDAALDFKNVSIVGNYIKERTKNAQFIIISLRSQMFELADHLVGIFKTYNITKSTVVKPRLFSSEQSPRTNHVNGHIEDCVDEHHSEDEMEEDEEENH